LIFGIFVLIYGSFLLLKNTIFDTKYTIKRVVYDSGDVQRYDDPYLYKKIKNWMLDENYYVVKKYKHRMVVDIQKSYPMVKDIGVDYRSSNTVFVKLIFEPVDMVIRNQENTWMVVGGVTLPVYSGNAIIQGIKILDLPEYLSGLESLS